MRKLLLLPMLLLAACAGNGTTPCHGTIVTTFSGGTWEDGDYTFFLELYGDGSTCEFTLPDGECQVPVEVVGDTLTIEHRSGTSQNPETVHVRLEREGVLLYEGDVTPAWIEEEELSSSSGTCWSTDIDVDLGA